MKKIRQVRIYYEDGSCQVIENIQDQQIRRYE